MSAAVRVVLVLALHACNPIAAVAQELEPRIPARALPWRKTVHAEVRRQWGLQLPTVAIQVAAGTLHQESGWRPAAQSSHAKGFAKFTDPTWSDMVKLDPSIATIGDVWNPQASIRAMALYHRRLVELYRDVSADVRWQFALSGYNGGPGWTNRDRTRCRKVPGCNASVWFGHVEKHSARAAWALKENRHYVDVIWNRWRVLYERF